MIKNMRSLSSLLVAAGALALVTVAACSDNPSDSDQANVTMQSQLSSGTVTLAKSLAPSGASVDSLRVTKVRVLVSRLKLHRDKEDTTGDRTVKTEPFVMTFEPGAAATFAQASIPAGTYDKVKFEFHRPEGSKVAEYLASPILRDFVTGGEYTVLIDVTLYKDGAPVTYTYKSDVNANLSLNFDTPLTFDAGSTTVIMLNMAPADVFKDGSAVLDPRDSSNESKIDNAIKSAIHAHKK